MLVTFAAGLLGYVCGAALGLLATNALGIGRGYFMIAMATLVLGLAAVAVERLRPRSGAPIAALAVVTLLAAGPLGLYYVLPAIVIVTPIALYRALAQKYQSGQAPE
jgi:hypothetical protein